MSLSLAFPLQKRYWDWNLSGLNIYIEVLLHVALGISLFVMVIVLCPIFNNLEQPLWQFEHKTLVIGWYKFVSTNLNFWCQVRTCCTSPEQSWNPLYEMSMKFSLCYQIKTCTVYWMRAMWRVNHVNVSNKKCASCFEWLRTILRVNHVNVTLYNRTDEKCSECKE